MKQNFDKNQHNIFKSHFSIQDEKSDIDIKFIAKTIKYIRYIKNIPWLRMIWIGNSIAMNSSSTESDIDLFIVTTPNSLWFNRIIITFLFQILGVRKTTKKHAWRFCLSFFATTDWLNFRSWKIENDIYLYFWIVYFIPILDHNNTYDLFLKQNNSWADFSQYTVRMNMNKNYITYNKNNIKKPWKIIEKIDSVLKMLFLPKTLKHYEKIWHPYWVIITDHLLKFHNGDIRESTKKDLVWD